MPSKRITLAQVSKRIDELDENFTLRVAESLVQLKKDRLYRLYMKLVNGFVDLFTKRVVVGLVVVITAIATFGVVNGVSILDADVSGILNKSIGPKHQIPLHSPL